MGLSDVLWLFFLIITVQPIIRQKMLEASRLRLLTRLERQRGSRVIALVHRQETMSLLGFPLMRTTTRSRPKRRRRSGCP